MFGNAPRALWERWAEPDDRGRISLACRAALVDDGERKILLETGIGSFFEPRMKERFGVVEDEHVLLSSLERLGVGHEQIDAVVLSHLHFDHAGGLLEAYSPGHELRLLFPNARFIVGKTAFARAQRPHPRDRASYIEGLPQLLEDSGRLELIDDSATTHPWLGPAYTFDVTYGHTPGMLHTTVHGSKQSVFFCADLVPGRPWVNAPITMGYDRFPEQLIDEKLSILPRLAEHGSWLFFTHDPDVAMARIGLDDRGRWHATETRDAMIDGCNLDQP